MTFACNHDGGIMQELIVVTHALDRLSECLHTALGDRKVMSEFLNCHLESDAHVRAMPYELDAILCQCLCH